MDPITLFELTKVQYQKRLKEAEAARLYRRIRGRRTGFLKNLANHVVATVQQWQVAVRSNQVGSIFNEK